MPISELTVPDRGDRPDPLRPLHDDEAAVSLRESHVAGEAIAHAVSRVILLTGSFLLVVVGFDLALMAINGRQGPTVQSVGAYLAFAGDMIRTPQGVVPRFWPSSAPASSGSMLVGGVAMEMAALGSLLIALGFGLSRLRAWALWGSSILLVTVCGIAAWMASGLAARLDGAVAGVAFDPRRTGQSLTCVAIVLVALMPIALMTSTVRPVFRPEYRAAVALSPRLRPWRTGNRLLATLFVALLAISLFLLVVFGPMAMLAQEMLRIIQRMTYDE
jgi:hypothetical protein